MSQSLVSIQIIPKTRNGEDVIPYVDAAIEVIEKSGVTYEVNPLETTMEGDLSELFDIIKKMNDRMLELGSESIISQVKILHTANGASMGKLTEKYRS
ncbi:thiamine-binding protein [Lentibacillus salicampi]|uniref:Thiamine-binding protein n=1 Tax=Lentibacillus salicampi TaxID=175306 RepID=A0A4Y9AEC6_9BACI|nr:thiamine-binding protein [Lentibacillus salicampi]TFJ92731.1 thiamine-binding protein [Lentibacillus salicampi]